MELWIRSQDKKILKKCYFIEMHELIENEDYILQDDEIDYGRYKTHKRALEVLDEIQNLLMPIVKSTPIIEEDIKPEYTYRHYVSKGSDIEVIQLNTYVYQMPEE